MSHTSPGVFIVAVVLVTADKTGINVEATLTGHYYSNGSFKYQFNLATPVVEAGGEGLCHFAARTVPVQR